VKVVAVFVVMLLGCFACAERQNSGPPPDFVVVPGGFVHKSCLHGVPSEATVIVGTDKHLVVGNGEKRVIPKCAFPPRFMRPDLGNALFPTSPNDRLDGWQVYAAWRGPQTLNNFTSMFKVPGLPKQAGTQILYTFPGLQNMGPSSTEPQLEIDIIQPVLQYGKSEAGGGQYWAIASWYVTTSGDALFSPIKRVNPGDGLYGAMSEVVPGSGKWSIITRDVTTGITTVLNVDKMPITQYEPYAYVALEVYTVTDCMEYPSAPNNLVPYRNMAIQAAGRPVLPAWTSLHFQQGCNEKCTVYSPSSVDILF